MGTLESYSEIQKTPFYAHCEPPLNEQHSSMVHQLPHQMLSCWRVLTLLCCWSCSCGVVRLVEFCYRKRPTSLSAKSSKLGKYWNWRNFKRLIYAYSTCYVVGKHVGELVVCSGPSMYPTIHDGDLVIAERLSVTLGNLRRGDIVGALSPTQPEQLLCKRLTGMAYDRVTNCQVLPTGRIPKGHIYLEGDNALLSTDSRFFGPVPEGLVQIRLVLRGESNSVAALLKKAHRGWPHHQQPIHLGSLDETDPLLRNFADLRDVLNSVNDLCDMNPDTFLSPFLDVIRSEQTNGPVTAQALSSVAKFLSYGLIDSTSIKASNAVENIADAVTHAKFVGSSDSSSDEVVLLKILQVLRTLLLTPVGRLLSNESVCEMMQSCFRICFESALSELLRKAAESTLADMTQLLFTRLPSFKEDIRHPYIRKLEERSALRRETETPEAISVKPTSHIPYGLPCARELLRFLIALTNPLDRANTESMILMGLNLLTVALEAGADHLQNYSLLMPLVKNELCRALLQLLDTEKLPVFASTNRVCFLLFEALRTSLKFQMESYFIKLKSIVTSEQSRICYEQKEMALESIVELWRIPGLVTELYLNYDCDLYCSNLFEDLTKLLLENAFPVLGLRSTHILSLDALLTVIDTIDVNCVYRQAGGFQSRISPNSSSTQLRLPAISGFSFGKQIEHSEEKNENMASDNTTGRSTSELKVNEIDDETSALLESLLPASAVRANRMAPSKRLPSIGEVIERKKQKRIITEGTDLFNQDPKKGVEFLREKGILKTPLDPSDVVAWLRGNPRLDKKRIADYICNRKNLAVLDAFVRSFPFENTRLDDALRMFLETFRLPGEAAEISMVMQHFADHWYRANGEPFNHVDAAFTLAYAVIMLNTDQHNPQVRRNQQPMQVECFKRNLSGTNGGQDFDSDMLEQMFHAIRTEEIVMPAEQVGLVKENYLWKVLLRRGETKEGEFIHVPAGWNDHDLFAIIWGPATAALSFVFDKSDQESILQKSLNGYRKCASIAAHYGMSDVFDNLIIHLCKFSTLMTSAEGGVNAFTSTL
ncbi:Golgi-specific brefeldin A-resistance guanine nucleotide exchange factor 1 [Toxocara canis]|uniref:Golgi-specific brefeldin A-resistance guanine nucleotide exchange factor 1 n=1 Tax=Toxocara canis TaxID=6265 RepID=A0A0B2V902_TOXCA|nr:Golgi-specific brefeldin A-resistance guanine nucleotide exchange factor 1 [Toxocara canis]